MPYSRCSLHDADLVIAVAIPRLNHINDSAYVYGGEDVGGDEEVWATVRGA
jgi:hypothetical protein